MHVVRISYFGLNRLLLLSEKGWNFYQICTIGHSFVCRKPNYKFWRDWRYQSKHHGAVNSIIGSICWFFRERMLLLEDSRTYAVWAKMESMDAQGSWLILVGSSPLLIASTQIIPIHSDRNLSFSAAQIDWRKLERKTYQTFNFDVSMRLRRCSTPSRF